MYLGARKHLLTTFLDQAEKLQMKYTTRSASFDTPANLNCLEQLLARDKYHT